MEMAINTWDFEDAQTHFDEVIRRAHADGAQTITREGRPFAVVTSAPESDDLSRKPEKSLFDHLCACPEGLAELIGERNKETSERQRSAEVPTLNPWIV